jgi:glycosyltransferase involved in cell wall biosynthesis
MLLTDSVMNLALVTLLVSPRGGGVATYYDTVSRCLAALGHRVWLITSTSKDAEDYRRDGVRYTHVPAPRSPLPGTTLLLWELRVCRLLRQINSEHGLDVVEFSSYYPEGLVYTLMPRRAAVCIRLFEWTGRLLFHNLRRDKRNFLRDALCWVVMARADAVLPFSDALASNYLDYMGSNRTRERMFRHHGAIDVHRFKPTEHRPFAYQSLIGRRIILFAGRITRAKGTYALLEAYVTRIADRFPDTVLVLAGVPENPEDFARSVETVGPKSQVIHLGHMDQEQLPALYSHAYVFVGPSRQEPFGLVFVEALACGLPVISVDRGGVPEIVENGKTGILCPDNSVDAIAEALERILADRRLRDAMAQLARESVVNRFSGERIAAELVETYRAVSQRRNSIAV